MHFRLDPSDDKTTIKYDLRSHVYRRGNIIKITYEPPEGNYFKLDKLSVSLQVFSSMIKDSEIVK